MSNCWGSELIIPSAKVLKTRLCFLRMVSGVRRDLSGMKLRVCQAALSYAERSFGVTPPCISFLLNPSLYFCHFPPSLSLSLALPHCLSSLCQLYESLF